MTSNLVEKTIGNLPNNLNKAERVTAMILLSGRGANCWTWTMTHAWCLGNTAATESDMLGVQFFDDDRTFLVEPQLSVVGERMPRLQTLRYHPGFSVAWNGETLAYYQHSARKSDFSFWRLAGLFPEYFAIWTAFWIRNAQRMPRALWRTIARIARSFRGPKIRG